MKDNMEGVSKESINIEGFDIKLVIFDMDGLMFDTERLAKKFWMEASEKFNHKIDDKIFKKTIGLNIKETKEIYKKYYGNEFPYEEIRAEKNKLERNYISSNGVPFKKGLIDLLEYLKKIKLKVALATSTGKERAEFLLNASGIKKYFDVIICGDEIENGKPHPDIFLETCKKMGFQPENCIVLEDSENGIKGAYRAGMLPIMIPDMIKPAKDIEAMLFKKFNNLMEVKNYFEKFCQ
ncbi:MAG: HAD family phosphatase [Actinomycetota bacterium]|nr:HAD family phosphatase [Actinomycetota bacterium]